MVKPLRHRQTKEAATDMFDLKQLRHTSTLPGHAGMTVTRRTMSASRHFHGLHGHKDAVWLCGPVVV